MNNNYKYEGGESRYYRRERPYYQQGERDAVGYRNNYAGAHYYKGAHGGGDRNYWNGSATDSHYEYRKISDRCEEEEEQTD